MILDIRRDVCHNRHLPIRRSLNLQIGRLPLAQPSCMLRLHSDFISYDSLDKILEADITMGAAIELAYIFFLNADVTLEMRLASPERLF